MKILAIDTVSELCSVALMNDAEIHQQTCVARNGHSQHIVQMIDRMLADFEFTINAMDCIAVDTGPGSFTGVRIGLGISQGLAYSANLPVVGINSLEALASLATGKAVMPALDARMGQIYCALYSSDGTTNPMQIEAPVVCYPDELPFSLPLPLTGIGNGWTTYPREICKNLDLAKLSLTSQANPEARQIALLARNQCREKALQACDVRATYVRNNVVKNNG